MVVRRLKGKPKKAVLKKAVLNRPPRKKKLTHPRLADRPLINPLGAVEEVTIEKAKFSHTQPGHIFRRPMPTELPQNYGKDKIVLQARDALWLYTYWEIQGQTLERLKSQLGADFHSAKRVLRVYDITDIIFNSVNANRFFDIEVNDFASNWYLNTHTPGRTWCVEIGLRLADGRFIAIARSNAAHTPLAGPSSVTDEEWMIPEEMFARLYGMGFGLGKSSPVGKAWIERARRLLSSEALSSGISSGASQIKKAAKERKFWLVVDCELIVYGATEPDAKVTLQDRPVTLRKDGTFSMRFALPDGKHPVPVKAVSADNIEERIIAPVVSRQTTSQETIVEGKR